MKDKKFEEVVTHLQVNGYVFPGSQIYGGLSNSWDYGPLGVLIKNNVKNLFKEIINKESGTKKALTLFGSTLLHSSNNYGIIFTYF